MMKFHLGILTNQFDRKEPEFLREAAEKNGIKITFFDIREFTFRIPPFRFTPPKDLRAIDIFLSRIDISSFNNQSYLAAEAFFDYIEHNLKKPVLVNLETIRRCQDKFLGQAWMTRFGVATPQSYLCFSKDQALRIIKTYTGNNRDSLRRPLIYKPLYGHRGEGMELIKTLASGKKLIVKHDVNYGGIYLQEYLNKVGNQDLRIIANEYFIPYVYARKSTRKTEWKTNCALGAIRKVVRTLPRELKQMISKSVQAFGGGYLSIDIGLVQEGKRQFFTQWEAGCCIDFAQAHPALLPEGIDIPQSIIEYTYLKYLHLFHPRQFARELRDIQKKYTIPLVSFRQWVEHYH